MRIVRNNIIPIKGFVAMNLFGVLFVRGQARVTKRMLTHETIHTKQMREMGYVPFYVWYLVEWICKLAIRWNWYGAYCAVSFEREAYDNEREPDYPDTRTHYAWFKRLLR